MLYYHSCCGSAGIGRQARLRILWVYARVGSSPISRIDWIVRKPYIIRLFGLSFLGSLSIVGVGFVKIPPQFYEKGPFYV